MRYVVATVPATVDRTLLEPDALPGWERADHGVSQAFGDSWYDLGATALLIVPSVLSPFESNVLISQRHPEAGRIAVGEPQPAVLGARLFNPDSGARRRAPPVRSPACVVDPATICLAMVS
jgi:RES domain-containing protein